MTKVKDLIIEAEELCDSFDYFHTRAPFVLEQLEGRKLTTQQKKIFEDLRNYLLL